MRPGTIPFETKLTWRTPSQCVEVTKLSIVHPVRRRRSRGNRLSIVVSPPIGNGTRPRQSWLHSQRGHWGGGVQEGRGRSAYPRSSSLLRPVGDGQWCS